LSQTFAPKASVITFSLQPISLSIFSFLMWLLTRVDI